MSTTINFTRGTTDLDLPGPAGTTNVRRAPQYSRGVNGNGESWSYKYHSKKLVRWAMTLRELTEANAQALDAFFEGTDANSANGPTESFTYTHTDGTTYTGVRFVNENLDYTRSDGNTFSVSIEIEFEDQQIS